MSTPKSQKYLLFYTSDKRERECSDDMVIFPALVILRSKETCPYLKQAIGKNLVSENEVLACCWALFKLAWFKLLYVLPLWKYSGYKIFEFNPF